MMNMKLALAAALAMGSLPIGYEKTPLPGGVTTAYRKSKTKAKKKIAKASKRRNRK